MIDGPLIETARLTLRPPRADDFDALSAFIQDDRSRFVRSEPTLGVAWRAFATLIGHWALQNCGVFVFTLKDDLRPIGGAGPWRPADWPEGEIGWTIWSPADEGKGYATEAAAAARDHAYRALGWTTAVSYIDPDNAASIAVAKRLGARIDDAADRPNPKDTVYRHPGPEARP